MDTSFEEKIDDLIDEVVREASNLCLAYEWGTGSGSARKNLENAKKALKDEIMSHKEDETENHHYNSDGEWVENEDNRTDRLMDTLI